MNHEYALPDGEGRYRTTQGFCHDLMRTVPGKLEYQSGMNKKQRESWLGAVKTKLRELMAFPDIPPQPEPRKLWSQPRAGYRLEKWEAYPEPHSVVPYLMLVPDSAAQSSPVPAVICSPGSASTKELLAGEPELNEAQPVNRQPEANQMALWYARAGFVAVAFDNPGVGELAEGEDLAAAHGGGREKISGELIFLGRNYVGLSVFQKMAVLTWLKTLPFVDSGSIALSGHSLGTEPTMMLMILDESIRALVHNDFLARFRDPYVVRSHTYAEGRWPHVSPLWHVVPGLFAWFDYPDLLAAVAPRPLLICEGGVTRRLRKVSRAYEDAGAPECFRYEYYRRYRDPASRKHDEDDIPEGLSLDEWFEYANVDVVNHAFKPDLAVGWLREVLGT